ncbi:MAG: hypothetical protein IT429_03715 [Gemmataceae bacterium]|nr:hypothetical protein [Gemmataceae bacterium]
MIRYRYVHQLRPPAPFVNVTLRCPGTGAVAAGVPAQLDSAADRTVLPARVVEELGLVEDGRALFQGFAGEVITLPLFLVEVQMHDLPPLMIRAALGEREPYVLLGRDTLNAYRIILDGPQLAVEIEQPPAG